MKRLTLVVIVWSLALAACIAVPAASDPATGEAATQPIPLSTPTHIPVDLTLAQRAARAGLAKSLSVSEKQVNILSTEAVTWPNGCLGVQRLGVMCTQNLVPGFRIVLAANGKQYEIHTNQDGSVIAPQQPLQLPTGVELVAVKQLASNLGVPANEVKLVSMSVIEWPDSCLGVQQQGVMCAQMLSPGYLIVLQAAGRQYEYHTNQDASRIVPGSPAMTWSQQGGIAGLCENITVYLSGEVYGLDCRAGGDGRTALLTPAQRAQLYSWMDKLDNTTVDLSDPKGVSDAMSRTAALYGTGQQKASPEDEHALLDFGQKLFTTMYP